ncbi:MAG: recombinase family protein [Syntrophomonadaceae bacterium]|nr:recombinase family protein [Syntrophomonadaceae bacterium]
MEKQEKIVALYVRVSTEEQAREGYSVENQINRLKDYASFQGWNNLSIFADEGESAKNMNRPALKQLLRLIKQGKVSVVLTIAVDRLSRNLLDMLQFVELCEKHNTTYICASQNFDTSTPMGRMVLQILAAFAEFERSMIAARVKSGMFELADKKKRYLAVPPFGYQFDQHQNLQIVAEEAAWVSKAADMFLLGYGYRAIAQWLNESKVCTRKGAFWSSSTIRQMLTNELYTGKLIWNRRYLDKRGQICWRDPEKWVVKEQAHPPILTEEQWNAIQARITRSLPKGGQRQAKHRLSGLLICAYCGAKMISRPYSSKGPHKIRKIFVCQEYQKKGRCRFNYIFIEDAEAQAFKVLEKLAEGLCAVPMEEITMAMRIQEEAFKRRKMALDRKFQRQIQAFENHLITEKDLELARKRIDRERASLAAAERNRVGQGLPAEVEGLMQEEAKQLLWLWRNGDLPLIREALRTLFNSIVIRDKKIVDYRLAESLLRCD